MTLYNKKITNKFRSCHNKSLKKSFSIFRFIQYTSFKKYKNFSVITQNSKVCGIENRGYASRCHASNVNAHVDYNGACEYYFKLALMKDNEKGGTFEDSRCEMVYENGRCSPVNCESSVLPPGACCPICGKYQRETYSSVRCW